MRAPIATESVTATESEAATASETATESDRDCDRDRIRDRVRVRVEGAPIDPAPRIRHALGSTTHFRSGSRCSLAVS